MLHRDFDKYIAFFPWGEYKECPDFKTLYQAARYSVRSASEFDDVPCALICSKERAEIICALHVSFGKLFIWNSKITMPCITYLRELWLTDKDPGYALTIWEHIMKYYHFPD